MSTRVAVPKYSNATRPCKTCKYHNKGKCRLFLDTTDHKVAFAKVIDVRFDEQLCGSYGTFWSPVGDSDSDRISYSDIYDEWR
jgi:hypothetical protein